MILYPEKSSELKNYQQPQNAFLPRSVNIPLCEEYNTVCKTLVKPGDLVTEGQLIATAVSKTKAPIHSSLPGIVENIVNCQCPNGKTEKAIQISLKGSFTYLGKIIKNKDINLISPSEIAENIFENGLVNTFNTLKPRNLGNQIKTFKGNALVIRLFDDDPSCITDRLISKFYLNNIFEAASILSKAIGKDKIIVVKGDSQKIDQGLLEEGRHFLYSVNENSYSLGLKEKIIAGFNKTKADFKLSKNDLFCDSSTLYEVYQSLIQGSPSINKLIHISGNCLKVSCFLNVKIGTSIRDVIEQIGGLIKTPKQIIVNGSIRGFSAGSLDMPVTKYVKSISIISSKTKNDSVIYDCINCGNCRFVCNAQILPDIIYNDAINFNELSDFSKKMVSKCIGCSMCNMVCPARIPLSQMINTLKEEIYSRKEI